MKIYLAGNFHTDWRWVVKTTIAGEKAYSIDHTELEWLMPLATNGTHPERYILRDIVKLKQADLVFACITDDSPVNSGTSAEMGYAYALGIPILFVRESTEPRYDFVERMALSTFSSLDEGIEALKFILRR